MKRILQMVGMSLTMLILASCAEKLESNSIKSESYTEYFNLTDRSTDDYLYLEIAVKAGIPKSDVEKYVVGNGWRSVAVYELDVNKNVVGEWELKDNLPTNHTQTLRDCFEVKGFGKDQLIQFGLREGLYEEHQFAYNESDNSISLAACSFVSPNGKLVYLSDNVMVCVASDDLPPLEGRVPFVYMVVFEKVSKSTLKDWRKQCPDPGLWY